MKKGKGKKGKRKDIEIQIPRYQSQSLFLQPPFPPQQSPPQPQSPPFPPQFLPMYYPQQQPPSFAPPPPLPSLPRKNKFLLCVMYGFVVACFLYKFYEIIINRGFTTNTLTTLIVICLLLVFILTNIVLLLK